MKSIDEILKEYPPYLARGQVLEVMRACGIGKFTMENWIAEGVLVRAPIVGKWARYKRDDVKAVLLARQGEGAA